MLITRTAKIRLKLEQNEILPTVEAYTKAFNYICQVGHKDSDYNRISLHNKTYKAVREYLPAQLSISARQKAAEVLKPSIRRKNKCPKSKKCSIRYDANSFNIWFGRKEVSLLTFDRGRIKTSFYFPKWFQQYLTWKRKSAELIVRKKDKVYLCIVFEKEVEDIQQNTKNPFVLGIDRGINKLAVCSNNAFFNGNVIKVSRRYQRLRKNLQKCGSKSAKRHLAKISGRENCFRKDVNHCVSKKIVESLPRDSIIVLEDLKHIRTKARMNKRGRRKLHNWSFYQFEEFLKYKANAKGILVDYVDARYTSQKCSKCNYVSKSNRKSQSIFKCKKCDFSLNADLNAARNIEQNYRDAKGYPEGLSFVNQPVNVGIVKKHNNDYLQAPSELGGSS